MKQLTFLEGYLVVDMGQLSYVINKGKLEREAFNSFMRRVMGLVYAN